MVFTNYSIWLNPKHSLRNLLKKINDIFYSYTPTNLKGNRCEREVKVR